jgi:hypothetical protein
VYWTSLIILIGAQVGRATRDAIEAEHAAAGDATADDLDA